MMSVIKFDPDHFHELNIQNRQAWAYGFVTQEDLEGLAEFDAFSAVIGNTVVACAGVVPMHRHRAHCWALLAENLGMKLLMVHRAIKRYLSICPYRRIETSVECDHVEGHRWAKALGFVCEAERLVEYGENGADHALYRWAG